MVRLVASTLIAAALFAETAQEALQKRVTQFYDAMRDKQYRKAYPLVADDSQDLFLEKDKQPITTYAISMIDWTKPEQEATVRVVIETEMVFPTVGKRFPVKTTQESYWKLENGEWMWFVPAIVERKTPFGTVRYDPRAKTVPGEAPKELKAKLDANSDVSKLSSGIELKGESVLQLSRKEPQKFTFEAKNGMPGYIKVRLDLPNIEGLRAEVIEKQLGAGESSQFVVSWKPGVEKLPLGAKGALVAEPFGKTLTFAIRFAEQ